MSFFRVIASTLFLLFFCFCHSQNSKPNILVIIADDMGIDITNGYQTNAVMPSTPTLDSLRTNGLTFKNNWSSPVCAPTRAAIISGKYGIKTGVMSVPGNLDPSLHTSVFNSLSNNTNDAYAKAVIGKWHINDSNDYTHPQQHGVDHYEGVFRGGVGNYYNWEKITNGIVTTETEYTTSNFTNSAIDWLSNQSQPWLLFLSHIAPHTPFHIPPTGLYSTTSTNTNLDKYVAAIEAMDHEIGRLLFNLDEDTKDNTIIIFIGDNGTPRQVVQFFQNSHAKGSLYEGGVRVPMIISGKGVSRSNEEEEGLTQVSDIYATILEIAGTQLLGGVNNSLSLKPSFNCSNEINRKYVYTDKNNANTNVLSWAIRNDQYKLIEDENGNQEFYDIVNDLEEQDDLIGSLTADQQIILSELSSEANTIRTDWSCNDGISNGSETQIDDCDIIDCANSNSTNTTNIGCCEIPTEPNAFFEYIKDGKRNIYSNNFPNHEYCYNSPSQMPEQKYHYFGIDLAPSITGNITPIIRPNGRPARFFGVAKNGVIMAPAPAQPFIFENPNTGMFNWDWVFEPTNNQGNGVDLVGLDCSSAHTGGQGYHYHGNMFQYLEELSPGITTTDQAPNEITHIGWAADGFPILYRFGPDPDGNVKELLPSYQVKAGERPGDGIVEPCGEYNGKYTNDYEYICGKGDLDECNGINVPVTLTTAAGTETFNYYYVITSSFPQISRCLVGKVSPDFDNNATQPTGNDNDNDGFIEAYDCNDNNASINPSVNGNSPVLDNCSPLSTTNHNIEEHYFHINTNSANGHLTIINLENKKFNAKVYDLNSKLVYQKTADSRLELKHLSSGLYIVKVEDENNRKMFKKVIVK